MPSASAWDSFVQQRLMLSLPGLASVISKGCVCRANGSEISSLQRAAGLPAGIRSLPARHDILALARSDYGSVSRDWRGIKCVPNVQRGAPVSGYALLALRRF